MITYPGIDHTPIPEPETPLDTIDFSTHYTLFRNSLTEGYPPHGTFNIDLDSLKKEYIELQGKTHPDRYPRGPLKRRAEALSAHVGSAYRTMADPLLRAQYVLKEYHYIDLTSEKSSRTERLDPELLMEVMDVQEAIEAVGGEGGEGDRAEMEMEIEGIKRENEARIRDCVEAIATAFRRTGFDLKEAKEQTVRLKFWYSVQQALKDWEPGMGGIKLVH
ncbi:Co-chaperone Hsc20 [Aspergillus cavernicola]|uniref:Co-chaperone Hsc20 n=1 Tax=Aspergillus cavernicola TaxID=176166 RepID=A0ABR4I9Y8_9EURO